MARATVVGMPQRSVPLCRRQESDGRLISAARPWSQFCVSIAPGNWGEVLHKVGFEGAHLFPGSQPICAYREDMSPCTFSMYLQRLQPSSSCPALCQEEPGIHSVLLVLDP